MIDNIQELNKDNMSYQAWLKAWKARDTRKAAYSQRMRELRGILTYDTKSYPVSIKMDR